MFYHSNYVLLLLVILCIQLVLVQEVLISLFERQVTLRQFDAATAALQHCTAGVPQLCYYQIMSLHFGGIFFKFVAKTTRCL